MSFDLYRWALALEEGIDAREKWVLCILADKADADRKAWPSGAWLARRSRMARSTVNEALAWLRKEGLIVPVETCREGKKRSTIYQIEPRQLTGSRTLSKPQVSGSRSGSRPGAGQVPDREPDTIQPTIQSEIPTAAAAPKSTRLDKRVHDLWVHEFKRAPPSYRLSVLVDCQNECGPERLLEHMRAFFAAGGRDVQKLRRRVFEDWATDGEERKQESEHLTVAQLRERGDIP